MFFFVKIYGMVYFLLPYPGPKYRHMSGGFQLQWWPPRNMNGYQQKCGYCISSMMSNRKKMKASKNLLIYSDSWTGCYEMSPWDVTIFNSYVKSSHRIQFVSVLKNNAPTSPTGPTAEPLWRIWTIHDLRSYGYWRITPLVEPLKRRGRGYSYHEVFSNSLRNMEDFRGAGHKEATILERFLMGEL